MNSDCFSWLPEKTTTFRFKNNMTYRIGEAVGDSPDRERDYEEILFHTEIVKSINLPNNSMSENKTKITATSRSFCSSDQTMKWLPARTQPSCSRGGYSAKSMQISTKYTQWDFSNYPKSGHLWKTTLWIHCTYGHWRFRQKFQSTDRLRHQNKSRLTAQIPT